MLFAFTENNPDFFIQLKGDKAGQPLKSKIPNSVGVVANRMFLVPEYFYWLCMAIYASDLYKPYIHGSATPFISHKDIELVLRSWFINKGR